MKNGNKIQIKNKSRCLNILQDEDIENIKKGDFNGFMEL